MHRIHVAIFGPRGEVLCFRIMPSPARPRAGSADPHRRCQRRRPYEGHLLAPFYLDIEWFEAAEDYNGWEHDGLGHRMFGYLRMD